MEYERVHKPQTGYISPTKLRMIIGTQKKDGSNSKLEDSRILNNSLLAAQVVNESSSCSHEEETLDYDSTSSFEFHKGERLHRHPTRSLNSLSRPMPSKWDDAHQWILNRQHLSKKMHLQHRTLAGRFAPDYAASNENKLLVKRVHFAQPNVPSVPSTSWNGLHVSVELASLPSTNNAAENTTGVRAVSMRDMGTEMTPIPSQEPSRTASPLGSTPLRSPISSVPSTPIWGEPAPTPTGKKIPRVDDTSQISTGNGKMDVSEQDLKLKTRQEIVALGVRLGKLNIAAWAGKDEKSSPGNNNMKNIEFAKRAASWEDVEKTKHNSRYKRDETKIQVWENQQKAKIKAELRRVEAQAEHMKAQAQAYMVKKIALARQRSEEKRAAAEARMNKKAEQVATQSEYIRHSGRLPTSFLCCGWS